MTDTSKLSDLVEQAIDGDVDSENKLAQMFLSQAMAVLPNRSAGSLPAEDQEDIAISAVKSFCIGIRDGRFQYQGDRQLYALLYKIIDGKIRKLWQYHFAAKRDINASESLSSGAMISLVSMENPSDPPEQIELTAHEKVAVDRILEDLQTELHGLFSSLLNDLDEHPRRLLLEMLQRDADNLQLAETIGRSVASVERYRKLIREKIGQIGDRKTD